MTIKRIYRQKLGVLIADILAFLTAFAGAVHLRFNIELGLFTPGLPPWSELFNALPVVLAIWLITLRACGLYAIERLGVFRETAKLFQATLIMLGVMLSFGFFYRGFSYSRGVVVLFVPLLIGLTAFLRIGFRWLRARLLEVDGEQSRVLLIGATPLAKHLIETSGGGASRICVVGVLDNDQDIGAPVTDEVCVVGAYENLTACAQKYQADGVIVTTSKLNESAQLELLDTCLAEDLQWQIVPNVYDLMLDRVAFEVVGGVPVLGLRQPNIRGVNRMMKRIFDMSVASLMLLALSPLMLVVATLIKLSSRGPIFYTQDRVGEGGKTFKFIKFRSMHVNNDDTIHREYARQWIEQGKAAHDDDGEKVYKIKKDPRLIPIGGFIRKYSVDELPQLFNVLQGDMSLIGPRPPIPYEVEVYREWHRRRLDGPQGITGLWQVSGRNRLSFDEMVKLDIEYIENWSFALDLKILWRTIGAVLWQHRAY